MSAYRAQAHIDAPLEEVWALVGNPATYPEWWPARWRSGARRSRLATFHPGRGGRWAAGIQPDHRPSRRVKELKWSCPTTGGFQHWHLTDAQGGTFVDMEMGIEPAHVPLRPI